MSCLIALNVIGWSVVRVPLCAIFCTIIFGSSSPVPFPFLTPAHSQLLREHLGANGCSWSKLLLQASPASCHFRRLQKCPMCSQHSWHSQHSWVLRCIITFSWCSFDVNSMCMYQVLWNKVTSLGPVWTDLNKVSLPALLPGLKRHASAEPELQPPAHRGPLLHKLDMVLLASNGASTSSNKEKGLTTQAVVVLTKATDKCKAMPTKFSRAAETTDSELSNYEDAVMVEWGCWHPVRLFHVLSACHPNK